MPKSKILEEVMRGRGSAARSRIKKGIEAVKRKKDFLQFMLVHGAEIEQDLTLVFTDCRLMRENDSCNGCPFYHDWQGCLYYDKWKDKIDNYLPEQAQAFLKQFESEEGDNLDKKTVAE